VADSKFTEDRKRFDAVGSSGSPAMPGDIAAMPDAASETVIAAANPSDELQRLLMPVRSRCSAN